MRITRGEKNFSYLNNVLLSIVGLVCFLPYITLLAKSLSSETYVAQGSVTFWPKGFNLRAYQVLINNHYFLTAFQNSVLVVLIGTVTQVFFTLCVGYVCSKDHIPGSKLLMRMYVFTMLFSGGMIPSFMVIKATGLMNNLLVMVIPGMVSAFNMIMARNYFYTIPDSLEESAKLDGATNLQVFFRIMLPMAIPSIATITIFIAVGLWNNYMGPLLYLTRSDKRVLSIYLKDIVTASDMPSIENPELFDRISSESFRAAAIFVSTIPILCVYPFLQKYFIVGMTMGAVKQ